MDIIGIDIYVSWRFTHLLSEIEYTLSHYLAHPCMVGKVLLLRTTLSMTIYGQEAVA